MTEAATAQPDTTGGIDRAHRRVIFASSLGTVFEWFDFYLYGTLAVFFGTLFFPPGNDTAAFLASLATFGAGFAVRPLGALVFGRIGDLIGRKYTFLITIGYRQLIDAQRKNGRRKFVRLGGEEEGRGLDLADTSENPVGEVLAEESRQRAQRVLGNLSPRDARVWEMVQADRPYNEVARELRMARGTVGTIVHRIRRKLQKALAE